MKRNADQIFNKYCKLLYKISIIMLCSEEDAYDAVQESFLKYLNTKKDFNDESHERAWLTRVNINICKNILRFRRMHPTVDYETLALHYHKPEETGIMDSLMTLMPVAINVFKKVHNIRSEATLAHPYRNRSTEIRKIITYKELAQLLNDNRLKEAYTDFIGNYRPAEIS